MPWEARRGKRTFYRRRKRVDGQRERKMFSGFAAVAMARLDAMDRAEREAAQRAERARRAKLDALDARVDQIAELSDRLVIDTLLAEGFHNVRGQWRKRRCLSSGH